MPFCVFSDLMLVVSQSFVVAWLAIESLRSVSSCCLGFCGSKTGRFRQQQLMVRGGGFLFTRWLCGGDFGGGLWRRWRGSMLSSWWLAAVICFPMVQCSRKFRSTPLRFAFGFVFDVNGLVLFEEFGVAGFISLTRQFFGVIGRARSKS